LREVMESFSTLDHAGTGAKPALAGPPMNATGDPSHPGQPPVHFPGEDGGRSLAEMAQRDLDAALQLLTDRAQYITGASGAAIALRRSGKNDMLCRASSGLNAPELGALLSTEFGLSGESVRTRQALRCDDAERDVRVNREVCREMGIASVVVMPVVNDDEVLGVFELFSGKANAFGVRDVSAIQRLSEMVETAVRLAHAAEGLTERLNRAEPSAPQDAAEVLHAEVLESEALDTEALEGEVLAEIVLDDAELEEPMVEAAAGQAQETVVAEPVQAETGTSATMSGPDVAPAGLEASVPAFENASIVPPTAPAADAVAAKKALFWSAALNPASEVGNAEEADESHVPPVLRKLHKCEACGFPVSTGRALCVECEEKKWRGQLRVPAVGTLRPSVTAVRPEARAFAASAAVASSGAVVAGASAPLSLAMPTLGKESHATVADAPVHEIAAPAQPAAEVASPEFVLSAGLAPSQSWLGTNKYVIAVLLVVAAGAAAFYFLR
jgi:hypothetical protein